MRPSRYIGAVTLALTPWFYLQTLPSTGYTAIFTLYLSPVLLVIAAVILIYTAKRGDVERGLLGCAALGAFICWLGSLGWMAALAFGMAGLVLGAESDAKRLVQVLPFTVLLPAVAVLVTYVRPDPMSLQRGIAPLWLIGHAALLSAGGVSFALEGWLHPAKNP